MPRKGKGRKRAGEEGGTPPAKQRRAVHNEQQQQEQQQQKRVSERRVLRYDEVMGSSEAGESATALFELANATHVVFNVGGCEITIAQDPSVVGTGGCIWETSYLMAEWMQPQLSGGLRRCLEVGAGCGLLGLALAHSGCDVLLTEQESAMANLAANVEANTPRAGGGGGGATAQRLSWTDDADVAAAAALGPWDAIVGTDVVYTAALVPPLLETLRRLCLQERDKDAHAALLRLAPRYFGRVARLPLGGLAYAEELECFLLELGAPRDAALADEVAAHAETPVT